MRKYFAHLFDLTGRLVQTLELQAKTFDEARTSAHAQIGTPEFIASHNHELWVVPA